MKSEISQVRNFAWHRIPTRLRSVSIWGMLVSVEDNVTKQRETVGHVISAWCRSSWNDHLSSTISKVRRKLVVVGSAGIATKLPYQW